MRLCYLLALLLSVQNTYAQTVELRTDSTIINSKLRVKNHGEGSGKVLTSDANGNASWQAIPGLWQSNGNFIRNTNNNGFWSPYANALSTNADDITNPPASPSSGNGTRMSWIPSRSAFQGGTFNMADGSVRFISENIGLFSFCYGLNSEARSRAGVAIGENNITDGASNTIAIGEGQSVRGQRNAAFGFQNEILDGTSNTVIFGESNQSLGGEYVNSFGWGLRSAGYGTSYYGTFNSIPTGSLNSWVGTDPLFIIGNGQSDAIRSNAMTILKNGNLGLGVSNPSRLMHIRKGTSGVAPNGNSQAFLESNTNMYLGFGVPNNSESGILFGRPDKGSASGGIIYTSSKSLVFRTFANNSRMVIDSLGNVGIGTITTLAKKLEVNGEASITNGLQLINLSGTGTRPLAVDPTGNLLVGSNPSVTTSYSKNYNISAAGARKIGPAPDANFTYMATACLAYFSVGTKNTEGQLILPVEFPDDAILQAMTLSAIDNATDNGLEAILFRVPQFGSPLSQAVVDGVQSTGNNAAVKEFSKLISHTVNNKSNYYYILVQVAAGNWQDTNLALRGVNFEYSITY